MKVTSCARGYHPSQVRARYVRAAFDGKYRWCEVGDDRRYDLRQGTVKAEALPADVREAADARRAAGVWPFNVEWPLVAGA